MWINQQGQGRKVRLGLRVGLKCRKFLWENSPKQPSEKEAGARKLRPRSASPPQQSQLSNAASVSNGGKRSFAAGEKVGLGFHESGGRKC